MSSLWSGKKNRILNRFQTSPLYRLKPLMITCEWNQQSFYFEYEQTVQKILFHPFRKAQNTRKVMETSNKPVFKDKILTVWRGRIISERTNYNMQAILSSFSRRIPYYVSVNIIFSQNKNGSDLHLSNRPQVSMVYKLINHAGCW